ncbi:MAG TPA: ATP-binding protein, partial [Chloroflexota bacterium]|nr:ATP-binding protein [Chloroflexota bacterium]
VPEVVGFKDGIVGEAAASMRTVLVRDIPADLPFKVNLGLDRLNPRWVAAVPLSAHKQLVGVLLLAGLRGLEKETLEFLEDEARQLAVSLQNALAHERIQLQNERIYAQNEELRAQSEEIQAQNEELQSQSEEIQTQNEELQSQNEELSTLAEELAAQNLQITNQAERITRLQRIAVRLSESLSPQEVLDQVVGAASELTGSALASALLLDEAGEFFSVAAAVGLDDDKRASLRLGRSESLAGRAIAERQSLFIADVRETPQVRFPQLAGGRAVGSIIVAPMIFHGEALGVIEVYWAGTRSFSSSDMEMMSALGSAAAVAVYNSRLFDAIVRQRRLLDGILAGIPEAVLVVDGEGRVTMSNEPAHEMFGVEGADLLSRDGHRGEGEDSDRGTVWEVAREALAGRELLEQEIHYRNSVSGREGYAQASAAPVLLQGDVRRAVVVATDISRLKAIERAKDEFFSVASHELKSPLTSVKGYAQLLEKYLASGAGQETLSKMTRTIVEQSDRVVQQVNRLLDLSRAQVAPIVMKPERMDLAELVKVQLSAAQVKTESHQLVADLDGDLTGKWDRSYLEQVLTNLLDNAVRYSPGGGEVRVAARRSYGVVRLSVSDHGIGIPPELQEKVFERHFRTQDAKQVRVDGMGIGLYLVRQIVEAHSGKVWVESVPGQGSTFIVELPVEA